MYRRLETASYMRRGLRFSSFWFLLLLRYEVVWSDWTYSGRGAWRNERSGDCGKAEANRLTYYYNCSKNIAEMKRSGKYADTLFVLWFSALYNVSVRIVIFMMNLKYITQFLETYRFDYGIFSYINGTLLCLSTDCTDDPHFPYYPSRTRPYQR